MEASTETQSNDAWNKIFEVLRPPSGERVHFHRIGASVNVGDFAWASPRSPKDKEGMVHLTGYDEDMHAIWHADFELSEVRYVGPKSTSPNDGKNPFPIKKQL